MSYPKNQAEKCLQIYQTINQLISQTQNIDRNYASLKQKFENLSLIIEEMFNFNQQYEQCLSSPSSDNHQQIMQYKQREDAALQVSLNEFKTLRISFVEAFNNVIETAEYVLNEIIAEHLQNWRENQILVGNGFQQLDPEILNKIQSWCENLAQVLWNTRMQLMAAPMYSGQLDDEDKYIHNVLNELSVKVLKIMHTLVKETVIIEVQPPQVIKKNTRCIPIIKLLIFLEEFLD